MTFGNGQGQSAGKEPVDWAMDLFVHMPIGFAVMAWKRVPEFVGSVPDLVGQALSKGCSTLAGAEERISEEVRKARMIGEVAVTFGGRQLRREVDARLRDAKQAAGGVAGFRPGATAAAPAPNGSTSPSSPPVTATATPTAPASPDAETAAKKPAARKTTGAKSTGARKTATAKAPSVAKRARRAAAAAPASAADLPIREYDGLSASQVVSRLTGLTPGELGAIRSYEEGSRGRRTILVAIDRLLT